jgi:CopG family nickel-responsive transcriptional regulator
MQRGNARIRRHPRAKLSLKVLSMERFTISLDEELATAFDSLISKRGYRNRSEAVRDLVRAQLESDRFEANRARFCVGNLSYVYNHHERELAGRLTQLQHDHHDLGVATMHAHLDHENCLESVILKGPTAEVRGFAEAMIAERGVRHGQLNLISVESGNVHHVHAPGPQGARPVPRHRHYKPLS